MRQFFHRNKTQKFRRDAWVEQVEIAEEQIKEFLRDEYVHYLEYMPDVKEFLQNLKVKEEQKAAARQLHLYKEFENKEGEVEFDTSKIKGFAPFYSEKQKKEKLRDVKKKFK